MTETNMNTSNPYNGERRPGTVGFALPGVEVKITDAETGDTLPNGEVGQLEVRGPNVFKGYWKMPEKTAEEIREDKEIELVLDETPGVVESAVIGVPHPDFGETVVAIMAGDENEIDLKAAEASAAESLASFKRPRKFIVMKSLPRNAMGKVQKNALRNEFAALFSKS